MRRLALILVVFALASFASAEVEFSLQLSGSGSSAEAAKEARLMMWNSPEGRLNYHVNAEYSNLLRGGQPGAAAAPVFRIKLQNGVSPQLITASVNAGVDISNQRLVEIPWPWLSKEERQTLSFEEQLNLLLSERLLLQPNR